MWEWARMPDIASLGSSTPGLNFGSSKHTNIGAGGRRAPVVHGRATRRMYAHARPWCAHALQHLLLAAVCLAAGPGRIESMRIPEYTRGPTPNFMIPPRNLANGVTYLGSHERLRAAIDRVSACRGCVGCRVFFLRRACPWAGCMMAWGTGPRWSLGKLEVKRGFLRPVSTHAHVYPTSTVQMERGERTLVAITGEEHACASSCTCMCGLPPPS